MTEPLSSREIEDVLSSIRRLVSEELRPVGGGQSPATPSAAARPAGAERGKLLLTPALRVVGEGGAPVLPAPGRAAVDPVLLHEGLGPLHGAAPGPAGVAVEAAGALEAVDDLLWAAPAADDPAGEEDEPPRFRPAPRAAPSSSPLGARTGAGDVLDSVLAARAGREVPPGDRMSAGFRAAEPEEGPAEDPAPAVSALDAVPMRATDGGAVNDPAAGLGLEIGPGPETGTLPRADPGLTELDEDMLRAILRELIREELAGGLGEKITRNVRKLVRIEINRALTLQALD